MEEIIEGLSDRLSRRRRKLLNTLLLVFASLGPAFLILTLIFYSIRVFLDPDEQLFDAAAGFSTVLFGVFSPFTLWYVRRHFGRRKTEAVPAVEDKSDDRQKALTNVQKLVDQRWDNLFLTSIEFLLDLRFEMSAIRRPRILPLSFMDGDAVPQHDSLLELFNNSGRSLLILGKPGTGKSFTLLRLTKELLAEALADPEKRIPVILNLASWSDRRFDTLEAWAVDELAKPGSPYGLSRELATAWVEAGKFIYLLDGLDEVIEPARTSCLTAINAFFDGMAGGTQKPEVVLCSRVDEYKTLSEKASLWLAVRIEPLSEEELDRYLSQEGLKLTAFRQLLEREPELREKINTPLMLSIITLAYRNVEPDTFEGLDAGEDFEIQLYQQFTERMFVHRPLPEEYPFDKEQSVRWLSNLARGMNTNNPVAFYIEELQPNWLPENHYRWYKTLSGLIVGLIGGLIVGLIGNRSGGLIYWLIVGLIVGLSSGLSSFLTARVKGKWWRVFWYILASSFITGLIYWPIGGLIVGLIVGLSGALVSCINMFDQRVKLMDAVKLRIPSRQQAIRSILSGLIVGLIVGLIGGLIFGLSIGVLFGLRVGLSIGVLFGLRVGLNAGVIVGLIGGLSGLVIGILLACVGQPSVQTEWQRPNQGVHNTLKRGLLILVIVSAFPIIAIIIHHEFVESSLTSFIVLISLFVVPFSFFYYGGLATIQHYCLRWMLARRNILPLKLVPFLRAMEERLFLEPQGGGWKFFHSTYQEKYLDPLNKR